MSDIKITDLVDEKAMQQLQDLSHELDTVVKAYEESATRMAEGLKIKVEGKEDLDRLYQIMQAETQKTNETNVKFNAIVQKQNEIVGQTTNVISRELAEIEKENAAKREAYAQDVKAIDVARSILGTRSQNIQRLAQINTQLKAVSEAQKTLNAQEQSGAISGKALIQRRAELISKENELKIAKSELNNVITTEEKMNQAAEGSYTQLSLKLELMKKAYKSLNEEEKQGAEGKALAEEIANTDAHLKDLSADMGEFQRNVGNYAVGQQSVKAELKGMIGELAGLTVQWRSMSDEEKKSEAGQAMKAHMDELTMKAGKLKDAISDVKQEIGKQASDTQAFDAIAQGVNLLVSGFGAATGAAQMLGLSEKDVQQVQADLQSALVISNGLTQAQTALQRESALMQGILKVQTLAGTAATKIATAAQGENIVVTTAATIAQKAFNAVAKANPYVLLAAAILTVVGALVAFTLGSNKESEAEKQEREEREKANAEYRKSIDLNYQLADARDKGIAKSTEEITKLRVLYSATQDHTKSMNERLSAIAELRKTYPSTFANLTNEAILAGRAAKEYDNLAASIWKKAIAEAQQEKVNELAKKHLDLQKAITEQEKQTTYYQQQYNANKASQQRQQDAFSNSTTDYYAGGAMQQNSLDNAVKSAEKAKSNLEKSRQDAAYLRQQLNETDRTAQEISKSINVGDLLGTPGQTPSVASPKSGGATHTAAPSKEDTAKDYDEIKAVVAKYEKEILEMKLGSAREYSKEERELTKQLAEKDRDISIGEEQKSYSDSKKELDASLKQKKITQEQYDDELARLQEAHAEKLAAIQSQMNDKMSEADDKYHEGELKSIQDRYAGQQTAIDFAYKKQLVSLKESLAKGKITQEQYDEQENDISIDYAQKTTDNTVKMLQDELNVEGLTTDERKQLNDELTKAEIENQDKIADKTLSTQNKLKSASKKDAEQRKTDIDGIFSKASKAISSVSGLMNAMFSRQSKNIEKQEKELEDAYSAETDRIDKLKDSKIITSEEAEARKRAAEEKTEQKKAELEKKKAALTRKQAIYDKGVQIAEAGMATARAIMEAAPKIPIMALMAAMGAIETAAIIATPLPSYAKGTERHKGGPALVGDAGHKEVILFRDKAWITPDKPTLMDIPEGAKVLPRYDRFDAGSIPVAHHIERSGGEKAPIIIKSSGEYMSILRKVSQTSATIARNVRALHADNVRASFEEYRKSRL